MTEYITRQEHQAAIDRLDKADGELRQANTDLERVLRTDYEQKIASAITDLKGTIAAGDAVVSTGITRIESHLTWQDRTLAGGVVTMLALVVSALVLHFGFGVG